jgi:putative transposase
MTRLIRLIRHLGQFICMLLTLLVDSVRYLGLCLRLPAALAAENIFLRKQLALYQERHVKPWRATHATRVALVWLARWFDWRHVLAGVEPQTFMAFQEQRSKKVR